MFSGKKFYETGESSIFWKVHNPMGETASRGKNCYSVNHIIVCVKKSFAKRLR